MFNQLKHSGVELIFSILLVYWPYLNTKMIVVLKRFTLVDSQLYFIESVEVRATGFSYMLIHSAVWDIYLCQYCDNIYI